VTARAAAMLHDYMLAGGTPARWITWALEKGHIKTRDQALWKLATWFADGLVDHGGQLERAWLTAKGAAVPLKQVPNA